MRRDGKQGVNGGDVNVFSGWFPGGGFEGVHVAEFRDDKACFDEPVEEVVVGAWIEVPSTMEC